MRTLRRPFSFYNWIPVNLFAIKHILEVCQNGGIAHSCKIWLISPIFSDFWFLFIFRLGLNNTCRKWRLINADPLLSVSVFKSAKKIDEIQKIFSKNFRKIFKILKIVFIPLEKTVNDPIGHLKRAKIEN